ncbi:hypothetical protein Lrub_0701 [Legionella rubrilucens]|uniref:Uncharacterized protein n=1 Tax=Legionella rubrilucens TaxID=458 RepID=A0A0W0XYW6_9GAMM|nr:type IV secretion system protein [Legionella rubrilucens]KTD49602.1 hypothetical protein Lrub_0701 [Legionella rubrilucens]
MDTPTYSTVILKLTSHIDGLTKDFVFKGYQALAQALAKPIGSLCILMIILMGFGILRGLIKNPMEEFQKNLIRIGLVYMLAMNWGVFSAYVVALFINSAGEIGALIMNLAPTKLPAISGGGTGINHGLQSVFIEVVRVGAWTWDKASFKHWGPIFTATLIYLSGFAVVGFALFEIVIAKLMLSICLCTAPLFIPFTLFDKTRGFFDRWLGTLAGFSFVLIFVSTVVGFALHLIHWAIGGHYNTHAVNVTAVDWIPLAMVAGFCVMAILEVTSIAKSIGSACSTANGSAMVGGFIGGFLGSGRFTHQLSQKARLLGQALTPDSARTNVQTLRGTPHNPPNPFKGAVK